MSSRPVARKALACLLAASAATACLAGLAATERSEVRPVLVELFTSEGCSSCPPADRLLAHLRREQPVAGAQVIALAFHVDYWDDLGWRDPFSSREATERQRDYARTLGAGRVYTPQMVVDGTVELVGNRNAEARDAIARAAERPKAALTLEPASTGADGTARFAVRVDGLGAAGLDSGATAWLAIVEERLESRVTAGENTGLHLRHASVVRRLERVAEIAEGSDAFVVTTPALPLDPGWDADALRVVAFVQEGGTRRVLAAAEVPLAAGRDAPVPADPAALAGEMERCLAWIRESRFDLARGRLEAITAVHPDWQRAVFFLALVHHEQQRYGEARPAFERAIAIDPTSTDATRARLFYGFTLYYLGDAEEARHELERFVAAEPRVADAHYALGLLAFDADDVAGARRSFGTAIALGHAAGDARTEGKARAGLADVEVRAGRLAEARAELEAAVRLRPDAHEAYFKLAQVLERLGDGAGAARARAAWVAALDGAGPGDEP